MLRFLSLHYGEDAPHWQDSDRLNSINVWQRYASPVWFDIRQTNVLQYREARNEDTGDVFEWPYGWQDYRTT